MTTISTTGPVPHPRSRLRARLVLAGFATVGLAALAWAAFVQPLPRMAYNPSDSVAVGWYRIEPFDPRTASRPRPLSVDSIVLMPLPDRPPCWLRSAATCRPAFRCSTWAQSRHNTFASSPARFASTACRWPPPCLPTGCRPLPSLQLCRRLQPGELFLLSATNPASFDSRYFGPVSAFAVIGVAHPIWLETRP